MPGESHHDEPQGEPDLPPGSEAIAEEELAGEPEILADTPECEGHGHGGCRPQQRREAVSDLFGGDDVLRAKTFSMSRPAGDFDDLGGGFRPGFPTQSDDHDLCPRAASSVMMDEIKCLRPTALHSISYRLIKDRTL
jgi:hypothetical protein